MRLLDIPTDVPKTLPQCRLRTGDPQILINLRQVFAVPVKESPYCLIRAPACYQSVLIFAAFPPRTSLPCFNMNERLPRLGLKPTDSFHSREKFRLKFRMSALPGCAWTSSCMRMGCRGLLVHDGVWLKGETYQAAPTSQVSWGEVLVTACALLKWFPDLAVQRESLSPPRFEGLHCLFQHISALLKERGVALAHLPHANTHKQWADTIQGVRKSGWFMRFEGKRLIISFH